MNARSLLVSCCLVASMTGCRTAPKKLPEPPAEAQAPMPINVALRLEAATPEGQRPVGSEERLANGARFALQVNVTEGAYVYLGQVAPDGAPTLVFPAEGADHHLYPGGDFRIPVDGLAWLQLGPRDGREDFFLYASREPLAAEKVLAMLKDDAAKARPAPPPPEKKKKKKARKARKGAKVAGEPAPAPAPEARPPTLVNPQGTTVEGKVDLTVVHFVLNHGK